MDKIMTGFLQEQERQGQALAEASDIFSLSPYAGDPPWRYLMDFDCRGLVCVNGEIEETNHFVIGLTFGPDHLRLPPEPPQVLALLEPESMYHPNARFPFICIGDIEIGTGMVEIAHRCYEVLSFQRCLPVETDALNLQACSFVRAHMDRFPIDGRPLKRPSLPLAAAPTGEVRT